MIKIERVTARGAALTILQTLFNEYAQELDVDLCFQNFEQELANPLVKYGSPGGVLFLAFWKEEPAGCIALQPVNGATCEMKRLYVRPAFRRHGVAKALVQALLIEAKALCYKKMVLDTLDQLQPAIRLYGQCGFINTPAYYLNPLQGVVYMKKDLL